MSVFQDLIDSGTPPLQQRDLRIENLKRIEAFTGRPIIVYAADWTTPLKLSTENYIRYVTLDHNDALPFKELVDCLKGDKLDVLIHSPGGLAEGGEEGRQIALRAIC